MTADAHDSSGVRTSAASLGAPTKAAGEGKATAASLIVALRVRPLVKHEASGKQQDRSIVRVLDGKMVVVMDPDLSKDYLDKVQGRSKERKFVFDTAFDTKDTNKHIFDTVCTDLVSGVLRGLNATVFAYGATGSGKTYTMVGSQRDPGLMVRSLEAIFERVAVESNSADDFDVSCSYLEVYNEVIVDLLVPVSGPLELREDPDQGIMVAGLRRVQVHDANEIMALLSDGNARRKTEATNANQTSSRSHAVLEVVVRRSERNRYLGKVMRGKLAMVDLAGSERAAETNNAGQKLRDGANINRSLLALANCINALGKRQEGKRGMSYVPYRNSKLTRMLKDGLSGNSRTAMVATVSCGAAQYAHTINTLKYADRAKEIKTHISTNVGTVERHVSEYQRMIDELQGEVTILRQQLAERGPARPVDTGASDDALSWLHDLSTEISANVEERINLQKALYELEDANVTNRCELQSIEETAASGRGDVDAATLEEHRASIVDSIRENEQTGVRIRADIEYNETSRKALQAKIDAAIQEKKGTAFLKILSQYRLMSVTNQELRFQIAVRDEIVSDQREVVSNIWRLLEATGMTRDEILALAKKEGILMGDPDASGTGTGASLAQTDIGLLHQKSLTGARARYRYDFWRSYDAGTGAESSSTGAGAQGRHEMEKIVATPSTAPRARAYSARVGGEVSTAHARGSAALYEENQSLKVEVERLKAKLAAGGSGAAEEKGSKEPRTPSRSVDRLSGRASIKQKALGLLKGRTTQGHRRSMNGSMAYAEKPPKA
ncbi:kinesin-like protein [Pycnococcus provasolii]